MSAQVFILPVVRRESEGLRAQEALRTARRFLPAEELGAEVAELGVVEPPCDVDCKP